MSNPSDSPSAPLIRRSPAQSESIATSIVRAIEHVEGTEPNVPLYEAIDTDALKDLYEHGSQKVRFQYADYDITIQPDRTVIVSEPNT